MTLDAIAYAGMFVFGIVMALLGAVMPVLSDRLALGLDQVGTLFLVSNGCMLVSTVLVGPAMDRWGMKAPLALGAILVAAALALIAQASSHATLLLGVVSLGLGGGILNTGTNTLIADLHHEPEAKASALNVLGVFFGFGALLMPFSIGALLTRVGLAGLLLAAAGLCAATAAATLALRFPAPRETHAWPLADIRRFLARPLVIALALLLFLESGNEWLLGGYFSSFLTRELSVAVGRASYLLASFWAAIMLSRILLSRLVLRFSPHRVVLACAVVAAVGVAAVGLARGPAMAIAGIVLTGFALAGVFPTALGIAGASFREHSGTVFGILFTVALVGGMTVPWVAGHVAARAGLRPVFLLAAASFLAIAVLNGAARSLSRKAGPAARSEMTES